MNNNYTLSLLDFLSFAEQNLNEMSEEDDIYNVKEVNPPECILQNIRSYLYGKKRFQHKELSFDLLLN